MLYNFDNLPDRRSTESKKWHDYPADVLPMWIADMDFVSPVPVIQALRDRLEHGVFGYPAIQPELRQVIVERLETHYGWKIQPEDLVFLPGVITGFNLACHMMAEPGGGVVLQTPLYTPILEAPGNAGMTVQEACLQRGADGVYSIDWEAFTAAFSEHTRLFILCNPHNPVGRVYLREELERMAQVCLRKQILICADEIHSDLIYQGHRHIPIASLDTEIAQNTITLMAPSKTFNLAGLVCAFAVIQNPALREKFQHAHKGLGGGVNLMGLAAMLAAYRDGQEWLDQLLAYLVSNRDHLDEFVRAEMPGVAMAKPEGTYLAWLDCRQAGIPGKPYEFFLREGRVALNDGATFGSGYAGFVRLNFGCPRSMLTDALERMRNALLIS